MRVSESGEFEKQVAIITGGARELGRAVAGVFAAAGARVILSDKDATRGASNAKALDGDGEVVFLPADPADPADAARLVSDVAARLGRIDVLVHLGVTRCRSWAIDATANEWRADIDDGLSSAFYLGQAVGRHMLATGGSIVNVAAIDMDEAYPGRATAAAAANGIVGLSRALAVEWATQRVRVNVVVPGIILEAADRAAIERGERSLDRVLLRAPGHRLGSPEEVARAIAFLSGPRAAFITGQVLYADGGWNTWTQHPAGMRFP